MKKMTFLLFTILFTIALVSCGKEEPKETYEEKPITGIDPIFYESLGYYNEFPSAIRTSSQVQYVYYTKNLTKYDNQTDAIVVRKAELKNGKWEYGEPKTVLNRSESGWDSVYICSPDVIKGEFTYNGETYSYLMAYAGSTSLNRMNAQIGFAVAKAPDSEFIRVGGEPIISFDKTLYSASGLKDFKGAQEPSLVSYNKKGKIQLFYSFYEVYNGSYAIEMDCSNLNAIVRGGRMLSEVSGLSDTTTNTHLYSADWAFDPVHDEYIVCRNFSSTVTGLPSVAEAVQLVRANSKVISEVDHSREDWDGAKVWWSLCNDSYYKIGAVKTADDFSDNEKKWNGYYRIYNGTVISDAYGWMLNSDEVEILITSSALNDSMYLEGDQYLFSQMIHAYKIDIIRE